jgi:phage gpG-like protein
MKFKGTVTRKYGNSRIKAVQSAADKALLSLVTDGVLAIHTEAVRGVMKQSPGEKQTRYSPKREVTASKPGDPPNVDHGVFVKSIQFKIDAPNLSGVVGTNDERGPWFEFGTKKMSARPWLGPAWKKAQKVISDLAKKLKFKID